MATVLIGESVADIRWILARLFTLAGYDVTTSSNGDVLLDCALRAPPDLLVMDPSLPGITGLEVCRRLRADPTTAQLPIIVLSVRHQEREVAAARAAGVDDYIGKPFDNRDLLARAQTLLQSPATATTEPTGSWLDRGDAPARRAPPS